MWNEKITKLIIEISQWSYAYFIMYSKASKDYENYQNKIGSINIGLDTITALFASLSAIIFGDNIPRWVNVIIAVLAVLGGLCARKLNEISLGTNKQTYDTLTKDNFSLFSNIRRQLSLPETQRQTCEEYLSWISKDYDRMNNSNILDQKYYDWYEPIAKAKHMKMPGVINFDNNSSSNSIPSNTSNSNATPQFVGNAEHNKSTSSTSSGLQSHSDEIISNNSDKRSKIAISTLHIANRANKLPKLKRKRQKRNSDYQTDSDYEYPEITLVKGKLKTNQPHPQPQPNLEFRPQPQPNLEIKPQPQHHQHQQNLEIQQPQQQPQQPQILEKIAPNNVEINIPNLVETAKLSRNKSNKHLNKVNNSADSLTSMKGASNSPRTPESKTFDSIKGKSNPNEIEINVSVTDTNPVPSPKEITKADKHVESAIKYFTRKFNITEDHIADDMPELQESIQKNKKLSKKSLAGESTKNLNKVMFDDKYNDDRMKYEITRQI